ncbi:MAG: hypothetical protein WCL21_11725 [Mariniphaga sp.]
MVTITDYSLRTTAEGKEFYSIILQGGIEMVKSKATERFYATIKKCSITSTFDEATCKASIGERIPGSIQKQTCEPYSYVAKETGEILTLTHRWVYLPEGASLEEAIYEEMPAETSSIQPIFLKHAS